MTLQRLPRSQRLGATFPDDLGRFEDSLGGLYLPIAKSVS